MHPDPAFRLGDQAALRMFAARRAFAHIFVSSAPPLMAHAPVEVTAEGHLRFHLARRNPAAAAVDGSAAIASIAGPDAYVSPDWYRTPDQVPTWNYVAVEAHGALRRLGTDDLMAQLDAVSAAQEATLAPKPPWTRAKMGAGRFEAMLGAIVAFELVVAEWRGTAKLSQNKTAAQRGSVAEALAACGRAEMAAMVVAGTP